MRGVLVVLLAVAGCKRNPQKLGESCEEAIQRLRDLPPEQTWWITVGDGKCDLHDPIIRCMIDHPSDDEAIACLHRLMPPAVRD